MYIIFDLDDTLLKKDKTISINTINILKLCQSRGHKIVINTARPYFHTKDVASLINADYIITNSGAEIREKETLLVSNSISPSLCANIIAFLREKGVTNFSVQLKDKLLTTSQDFAQRDIYATYDEIENTNLEALKIVYSSLDMTILEELKTTFNVNAKNYLNGPFNAITLTSKHEGNIMLYKVLNDNTPYSLAFGDDYSDLEMLLKANIGVAMKNAQNVILDKVKMKTDFSNDEDGCYHHIQKLITEGIL